MQTVNDKKTAYNTLATFSAGRSNKLMQMNYSDGIQNV